MHSIFCARLRERDGRKQKRDEQRNNGHDDQQLKQVETLSR